MWKCTTAETWNLGIFNGTNWFRTSGSLENPWNARKQHLCWVTEGENSYYSHREWITNYWALTKSVTFLDWQSCTCIIHLWSDKTSHIHGNHLGFNCGFKAPRAAMLSCGDWFTHPLKKMSTWQDVRWLCVWVTLCTYNGSMRCIQFG